VAASHDTAFLNRQVGERYNAVDLIADDGFVATWEAIDERLERRVLLRVVSPGVRADESARASLRQARRSRVLPGSHDPHGPRILDGGEDPVFGPFLVAELTESLEPTRPISIPRTQRPGQVRGHVAPHAEYRHAAQSRRTGLVVLIGLLLICAAAIIFVLRVLAPADSSPSMQPTAAPEQTARPAPVGAAPQAAPEATIAPPTLVPPTRAPQVTQATASPADTIQRHYALITARNYAAGYALMSSRLQRLNMPADYAGWFTNKVSLEPVSISIISQTEDEAVVRSTVQSTDRVNGTETTAIVREEFALRREGGVWRIDQVTRI